jgi:hypothetical protein
MEDTEKAIVALSRSVKEWGNSVKGGGFIRINEVSGVCEFGHESSDDAG